MSPQSLAMMSEDPPITLPVALAWCREAIRVEQPRLLRRFLQHNQSCFRLQLRALAIICAHTSRLRREPMHLPVRRADDRVSRGNASALVPWMSARSTPGCSHPQPGSDRMAEFCARPGRRSRIPPSQPRGLQFSNRCYSWCERVTSERKNARRMLPLRESSIDYETRFQHHDAILLASFDGVATVFRECHEQTLARVAS